MAWLVVALRWAVAFDDQRSRFGKSVGITFAFEEIICWQGGPSNCALNGDVYGDDSFRVLCLEST
jgi:hypothetical protein